MKQSINDFLKSIANGAPVKYIGSGTDSDAYVVGEYVYRFPHNAHVFKQYQREAKICDLARAAVHVAVPKIEVAEKAGVQYSKHKMIMGKKWRWHMFSWRPIKQAHLADSLARFMADLHGANVSRARDELKSSDRFEYVDIEKIIPLISSFLTARGLRFFIKKYNSIVNAPVPADDMVLCHMGLKGLNSVVDDSGNLVGVFDFGNAGVHERWRDLGVIFTGKNMRLYKMVLRRYCKYAGVKYRKHRIEDLASIEHFAQKRWMNPDGTLLNLDAARIKKYLAHARALFYHMPMSFRRVLYLTMSFHAWLHRK